ncbi:hypothetical protein BaRGS_00033945, partial [Batillaria attramentaria]
MADQEIIDDAESTAAQKPKSSSRKRKSLIEKNHQKKKTRKTKPSDGTANPDDPAPFNCVPRYNMDSNPR